MLPEHVSPTAQLQTIDFAKLLGQDEAEVNRLIDICTKDGFFYLDLNTWRDGWLIQKLDECNGIVKDWFRKPIEEKSKTITTSDAHGYKRIGQQSGVKEGQRDGYESLRVRAFQFRTKIDIKLMCLGSYQGPVNCQGRPFPRWSERTIRVSMIYISVRILS